MSQKYNSEYVNENEAFFIGRNDIVNRYGNVISHYQMLPGLIGFWPMATVQRSTGNVPNYTPTYTGATQQDLVYNGNPTFNYITSSGIPYVDLDGTGDFLRVADNTDLDILGTEAQYANPGLTMGGWFWLDTVASSARLMAKWAAGAESYLLIFNSGVPALQFAVHSGIAQSTVTGSTLLSNQWYFLACRFVPSTSVDLWINNTKSTNAVGIIASIANTASSFNLGTDSAGSNQLNGRITLAFLCASALSDAIIQSIFQQTRILFGV